MSVPPSGKRPEQRARFRLRLPSMPKLSLRPPAWLGRIGAQISASPGRALFLVAAVAGVLVAGYLLTRPDGLFAQEPVFQMPASDQESSQEAAPLELSGWLLPMAQVLGGLAMLAAAIWLVRWLLAQGLAPHIATGLKVLLALTPLAVWPLAGLDGVYRSMQGELRSYLLLAACPFVVASVLTVFDRRRASWLAFVAVLALAGLFVGAGLLGQGPMEPVEHLRGLLSALSPDERMWWLALALLPATVLAVVAAIANRPGGEPA